MNGEPSRDLHRLRCLPLLLILAIPALWPAPARAQLPPSTILDEAPPSVTAYSASSQAGFSSTGEALAGGEDVNGDGLPDLLAGAPGSSDKVPGRAFVILGRARRLRLVDLAREESGIITITSGLDAGPLGADGLGSSVAMAGDVDGDGLGDFLVGAPGISPGGGALLVFGARDLPGQIRIAGDIPRLGVLFLNPRAGEDAGASVAGVGDVNGDGFGDFAIGAPRASVGPIGGTPVGRLHLIFGGPALRGANAVDLGALPPGVGLSIAGPAEGSLLGASLGGAGDLDADGFADFLAGAPGSLPGGAAFVLFGRAAFDSLPDLAAPDGDRVFRIGTSSPGAELGASLSGGRDATGDGEPDILVGAPGLGGEGPLVRGTAVLLAGGKDLRGPDAMDITLARAGVVHLIGGRSDRAGSAVALVPDIAGGAVSDILIGGPRARGGSGIAYVVEGGPDLGPEVLLEILGPPFGATFLHNTPGAGLGSAVTGLGDRNGDGRGDIALGAPGPGPGGRLAAGAVYEVQVPGPQLPGPVPRELRCPVIPGGRVSLSWANGGPYRSLEVLRDGAPIRTLPGDLESYIDTSPPAGERTYQVRADGNPELLSAPCRVRIQTLPVLGLRCGQVPGTTRVRLEWDAGDRYDRLALSVDGRVVEEDVDGDESHFEIDLQPGLHTLAIFDPTNGPEAPLARCEVRVVPPPDNGLANLTCALRSDGDEQEVRLHWEENPSYTHYLISRDGVPLGVVEGDEYADGDPPPGLRVYEVIGLAARLHPGKPARCSIEVPPGEGLLVRGRVVFADPTRTPILRGTVRALDAGGSTLGRGQAGAGGRFQIPVRRGIPATVEYGVSVPALGIGDPLLSHSIEVQVPIRGGEDVEVEVPLPVLAVAGHREGAGRWKALSESLEARVAPDRMARGALTFGLEGAGEIARTALAIESAVGRVRSHLGESLGAAPGQVDLVAHGLSGLAARAYLHGSKGGARPVRALALLGTPHQGTDLAGLDALAAAPTRSETPHSGGGGRDSFLAAGEQLPGYLGEFNRRFSSLRGAVAHLVAGSGGADSLDLVLGCDEHDGRVCRESAQGGVPGATAHLTGDTHEKLGQSAASIALIGRLLLDPAPAAAGKMAGGMAAAGGGGILPEVLASGQVHASTMGAGAAGELNLHSDTSGSVIIILNCELPGAIFFRVVDPAGNVIDPAEAGARPGVEYHTFGDGEGHQVQSYEFVTGQVGRYTALLDNSAGLAPVPYSIQIYLDSSLTLDARTAPSEIGVGEGATIAGALAVGGAPLAGATVEARVTLPDGSFEIAVMTDDGQGVDPVAGDATYTAALPPAPVAGLYLATVRAAGSQPFPFLREEKVGLVVRSRAASLSDTFSSGVTDLEPADGALEGLWIEGGIEAREAGTYLATGILTDLAGNPVASGGVLFHLPAAGPARFRIFFEGEDIHAARRDGPYRLDEIELLDGNRGFILCERKRSAHTTEALPWIRFWDPPPRFVRGDANADGRIDLSDAVAILGNLFSAGFELRCPDSADVNLDREIDITDAVYLLTALFLDGRPIPAPGPGCGAAPALGCPSFHPCD